MASNLDYLDPALLPLEDKVQAYLDAEKALHAAENNLPHESPADQQPGTKQQNAALRTELSRLEQEILSMLPTRDEWIKVNLGYGPSRVGAWHVPAADGQPERYELRVVH